MLKKHERLGLILACGLGAVAAPAQGQTFERKSSVTGPRGRTIERDIRIERRPGSIQRSVEINRPGGTFRRDVQVQRQQGFAPGPPPIGPGPRGYVEREVIVDHHDHGGPGFFSAGFLAAPFLSLAFGSPPPPPPPVYVYPEPVYVEPPPVVEYIPPQRYLPAPPPRTVVVDPVGAALARLQSRHDNSRRDGCRTLGRLGDPRAVPALINTLRADEDDDVREAAAQALGLIGDPQAVGHLQHAAARDEDRSVRKAAAISLGRIPRETIVSESYVEGEVIHQAPPATISRGRVIQSPAPAPIDGGPVLESVPIDPGPVDAPALEAPANQPPPPPTAYDPSQVAP